MLQPLHEPLEPLPALRISVLRWQAAPLPSEPPPPSFEFDPRGGCLGRDDSCELRLPDPQRHVSRLQARIEFDGQGFVLVDLGSNPTRVDGQALGRGRRLPLAGGERLAIGDYELEVVALTRGAHSSQPLSSPHFSHLSQSGQSAQSGQPRHGLVAPVPVDDPFAVFAAAKPPAQPASVPLTNPFPASVSPPLAAGLVSVLPSEPATSDVLGLGLALESASIDELFGLRASRRDASAGMVLSWDLRESAPPQPQPQFQASSTEAAAVPPPQREAPVDDPAAQLLAAFQRGLGQPPNLPAWLTPALMERVGQLLREVTQDRLAALRPRQSPDDGAS
jgi:FHA domain-containing protein